MARKPNENKPKIVEVGLPPEEYACLEFLKRLGGYGQNPTEVARYLIRRELDDLRRAGVITPRDDAANSPSTGATPDDARRR